MINNKLVILLLFIFLQAYVHAMATKPIKIWSGTSVRNGSVTLTPYLPENMSRSTGIAVIICPGGSYFWLDRDNEGILVCNWLKENGCAAFLLEYRTAGWFDFTFRNRILFKGNQYPNMLEDVQRAIQIVRENSLHFNIDSDKIGVMGFSAGGHLAMLSAVFCDTDYIVRYGIHTDVPIRPDFIAAIYPVVTMSDEKYVHKRSRRGLMGEQNVRNLNLRDSLSLEKNIRKDMPPIFLLNCEDDEVVDFHNSILLDSALTANEISHLYIKYKKGGHGFGANKSKMSQETSFWQEKFLNWLNKMIYENNR